MTVSAVMGKKPVHQQNKIMCKIKPSSQPNMTPTKHIQTENNTAIFK